ncbi:uncharacterized protein GIQ15_05714 [Arthroderma uncinatum]|uniref:uncharacterized protein n=1 Tax=Arthroderma uncinatum TaxID=74035 RepID=UPI00144AECCE|nr:uncharacterized protein GIQ15_05714 [Arthroderma uncinatum]KAF3480367.1 hypothetical protein GIQ15_05714 [Arthroderma uncinatum]
MAAFFEELFSSIFTPGATPTLLIATNATFAALQVVFFALLLATYSIHFVVLSCISGALWYSINWFAAEIKAESERQRKLEESKEKDDKGSSTDLASLRAKKEASPVARLSGATSDSAESGTETESIRAGTVGTPKISSSSPLSGGAAARRSTPSASGAQVTLTPESSTDELKHRKPSGDSSGYISTDSEWEKVDDKDR